ncbi:hypothetical protein Emed_002392 [Eimeria media]
MVDARAPWCVNGKSGLMQPAGQNLEGGTGGGAPTIWNGTDATPLMRGSLLEVAVQQTNVGLRITEAGAQRTLPHLPTAGRRERAAAITRQRSRETAGSPRWRSRSGSKGLRDASASVDQHSSTVRERTHDELPQGSDEILRRRSLDRFRRSSQRSSSGSRRREDAMTSKGPRSSSHRKSLERVRNASEEQTEDAHNRRCDQQAEIPGKVSPSRSPECPTPDLAKTGGDLRHCVDGERTQQSESELSTPPAGAEIAQATRERDSFEGRDKRASGIPELQEHEFKSREAASPPRDQSKARRSISVGRAPSRPRTEAGDDKETKERARSCSPTPEAKEHVPSEKDITVPRESSELPTAGDASDEQGTASNTASDQHKDDGVKADEDIATAESKKAQSTSSRSPESRRRSSSVPQSPLRQEPNNAAADPMPEPQGGERSESRQISNSECVERTTIVERNVANRRIVASGPERTPVDSQDIFRRAPSPRKNFRPQRQVPMRGERVRAGINRLQPIVRNRWSRLEVDEPFDYPQAHYRTSASRSVRLVGAQQKNGKGDSSKLRQSGVLWSLDEECPNADKPPVSLSLCRFCPVDDVLKQGQ